MREDFDPFQILIFLSKEALPCMKWRYSNAWPGMNDFEMMQKSFTKTIDAYGCLGIMRVNAGNNPINFFAHSQMTSALNWLHCSWLTFSYERHDIHLRHAGNSNLYRDYLLFPGLGQFNALVLKMNSFKLSSHSFFFFSRSSRRSRCR